jgi:hypothetical protein
LSKCLIEAGQALAVRLSVRTIRAWLVARGLSTSNAADQIDRGGATFRDGGGKLEKHFVISVPDREAIRLYHILIDKDRDEALAFLEEHAYKSLCAFLEGG